MIRQLIRRLYQLYGAPRIVDWRVYRGYTIRITKTVGIHADKQFYEDGEIWGFEFHCPSYVAKSWAEFSYDRALDHARQAIDWRIAAAEALKAQVAC